MSTFDIGAIIGSKNYSDLVNSTDPFDLYNFTLSRTGSFQLSLSGLSANADVQLLNSSGVTIASSTRTGTLSEGIFLDTLTAGSYTARVFQVQGNTNYNLNLTLGTGTHGNHIDPLTGMPFTSGVFTVGTNGQITTDFIFDGGWFKGELAAFSLNGMESLTPGSTAFIKEAARRAITNSQLGHILISNQDEGARISGSLPWEGNWNAGTIYRGVKTFSMPSGTLFGLMLIPNGRVQQVFDNPAVGGNLAPLFSLGTPATGDIFNFGQIADITGDGVAFAWEDFRVDQNPDNDYNDMIFQLTGASGFTALSNDLYNPQRNWKTFPVGQQILTHVNTIKDTTTPAIATNLSNDTGTSNTDSLTKDPTIAGRVTDTSRIATFRAGFNPNAINFNLLPDLTADGNFTLNQTRLAAINGGSLPDGNYTLYLQAIDEKGNASSVRNVTFTLDTTAPTPGINLLPGSDSGISNSDRITNITTPTIAGTAEAGATVQLFNNNQSIGQTTAAANGTWQVISNTLPDGTHRFTARASDAAGNISATSTELAVVIDTAIPQLNLTTPVGTVPLVPGGRLTGSANGTGSAIANLSYRFNSNSAIAVTLGNGGTFDQPFDFTGLTNGTHVLTLTTTDTAGNVSTNNFNVTVNIDTNAPILTAALVNDTGSSSTDKITKDPTIRGTVTDNNSIASFKAGFSPNSITYNLLPQLASNGSFTLNSSQLAAIKGSSLQDGNHTLYLQATDSFGNVSSVFQLTFTLDTTAPGLSLTLDSQFDTAPVGDNITEFQTVTLVGQTEANLQVSVNSSTTTANALGRFELTNVPLALGANNFTASTTDIAGNTSEVTRNLTRIANTDIVLNEGNSFKVTHSQSFSIPSSPSFLKFTIANINFDTTDADAINDALEVALVDSNGRSLVRTIGRRRDAFFNLTEGESAVLAAGVKFEGNQVSLDLSGVQPGTTATLLIRLVNNDGDVNTTARIRQVEIVSAAGSMPLVAVGLDEEVGSISTIDLSRYEDVSASMKAEYGRTTFNQDTEILSTVLAIKNAGTYRVRDEVLVGITNISDPRVRVRNADWVSPEGIGYYKFDRLGEDGILVANETTGKRTIEFYNPNGVQFDYDLVVLSRLNQVPEFTSSPDNEAVIGRPYTYDVDAKDKDNDRLTYSLLSAPQGMTIDGVTGKINWTPNASQVGNHAVRVKVVDGQGGEAFQQYSLSTIVLPPNRPPVFSSIPVVDARVNEGYLYQAVASDADSDNLTFSLVNAPVGMTVNAQTGVVSWTPTGNQVGTHGVKLLVNDGVGGSAEQNFQVLTQIESGNRAPIFISEPVTTVNVPIGYTPSVSNNYTYNLRALDPDGDSLTYTLVTAPQGMTINSNGALVWNPTSSSVGNHQVAVRVSDGRGGIETQSFNVDALASYAAQINGFVFHDINGDGQRFNSIGNSSAPVTVTGGGGSPITLTNNTTRLVVYGGLAGNGLIPSGGYYMQTDLVRQTTPTWSVDPVLRSPSGAVTVLSNNYVNGAFGAPEHIGNGVVRNTSIANGVRVQADTELLGSNPKTTFTFTASPGTNLNGSTFVFYTENDIQGVNNVASFTGSIPGGDLALFQYDSGAKNFTVRLTGVAGPGARLDLFGAGRWTGFGSALETGNLGVLSADGSNFVTSGDLGLALGFSLSGTEAAVTINYDNQPTPPDPGLVGVVYLDDNQNNLRDSNERFTTTDANGNYAFTNLAPGNYTVAQELQSGWVTTAPISGIHQVTVSSNQVVGGLNFGRIQEAGGVVSGVNFNDLNRDGIQQSQEQGWQNWLIYLDANSNGRRDAGERFTFTDYNGNYTFTNLRAGTYKVASELQPGFEKTAPTGSNHTVTVGAGQAIAGINFAHVVNPLASNQSPQFVIDSVTGTSNAPTRAKVGQLLRYKASATDADGDALTYSLPVKPDGMMVDGETGVVVWRPTADQIGNHDVILKVADGKGGVDLLFFQIAAGSNNASPTISSTPGLTATVNRPYQYRLAVQDADGDATTIRLAENAPRGMIIDSKGILSWTPTQEFLGQNSITVIVSDGSAETTQTFNLNVLASAPNSNPQITSTPRKVIGLGQNYFYQVTATDANSDPLTYSLVNAPTGMTINENGRIFWQPQSAQFGNNNVKVRVTDGVGGEAIQDFTINVRTSPTNNPPVIDSTPGLNATVGKQYRYDLTGNDSDSDVLLWSLDKAPAGMSIDPEKGTILWTPKPDQIGDHEVAVRVTDAFGAFVGQGFTLSVRGVNVAPTIISSPPTVAAVNKVYKYAVLASDLEKDSLNYSLVNPPTGMTINRETGLIEWTPAAAQLGSKDVEVLVEDSFGGKVAQKYTVVVSSTAANLPPAIISTPVYAATTNQLYRYNVTANDPEGESLQYGLIKSPTGMTINSTTGVLQWTPTSVGEFEVVVGATDASGKGGAQQFWVTVGVNDAPIITSIPPGAIAKGKTYQYDVRAVDPNGDVLSYTLNNAPQGMTIDKLGRIRWSGANPGSYTAEVVVEDTRGAKAIQPLSLNVVADNTAPRVNLWSSRAGDVQRGDEVTFVVTAADDVGVESVSLLVNGTRVALDGQGRATVAMNSMGVVEAQATATDVSGNTSTTRNTLRVIDSNDIDAPVLEISNLEDDVTITAPIAITGTVSDSNLAYYTLSVAPVAGGEFKEVFRGNSPVTNGVIATFDPSLLENDAYILRFSAHDAGGNVSAVERVVNVAGELKLGNFRLSFTDLEIPVSGIPISVTRTYDTLTTNTKDDFGYGWRLEFRDTDLRTSLKPDRVQEELGVSTVPFAAGTKVFITLPGGKRETFTFSPKTDRLGRFVTGENGEGGLFRPAFTSQKGSTNTLTVRDVVLTRVGHEYFGLNGEPFNPENPAFGGVYVLTTKEGVVYEIDAKSGDLLTVTDNNGNKLTYSDSGIFSSAGKQVTFERDAQGRIVSVKDPIGELIRYQYDGNGDLISVTDREENTTRFEYSEPSKAHFLTSVIDPLGREGVKTQYDASGRLNKMLDVNGEAVELIYDPNNSVQTVKDVFGKATTYVYDARGNILQEVDPLGKVTKRTYDENNYVLTETIVTPESGVNGWTTEYTYDDAGNKLTEKDPLGNVTRWTYNSRGQVLTETDALGNTATYTYSPSGNLLSTKDVAGNVTKFSYDIRGNLLTLTNAANNISRFQYDASGNATSLEDSSGNKATYIYDTNGNMVKETMKVATPTGEQEFITEWNYDKEGKIKSITQSGRTTTYEYDSADRQTASIDSNRRTEYRYNSQGKLVETIYPDDTPNSNSDNPRTITVYDKGGRQRATINSNGRVTHYKYDDAGRLTETIYPNETGNQIQQLLNAISPGQTPQSIDWTAVVYPDTTPAYLASNSRTKTEYYKNGKVKAEIDLSGKRTEYEYDAANRVTLTRFDANNYITYTYDAVGNRQTKTTFIQETSTITVYNSQGQVIATTDPNGKTTRFEYDAKGQLKAVVDALQKRTEYGYDSAGNLTTVKDANNQVTTYEYDEKGRRKTIIRPDNQRSIIVYDDSAKTVTITDFNNKTVKYTYNSENRVIAKQYQNASGGTVSVAYAENQLEETITDSRGTTVYKHNDLGQLISRRDPTGPYLVSGNSIEYKYDYGQITEVKTPTRTLTYNYDEKGRLQTVSTPEMGTVTYRYDARGNLYQTEFPNHIAETRIYDSLGRLDLLKTAKIDPVTKHELQIISSYDYSVDNVGNRTELLEHNGRKVEYKYDELNRLIEEKISNDPSGNNRVVSYTYDAVGNRLTKNDSVAGVTTYTYNSLNQLDFLTANGVVTDYTYDDNGNLISEVTGGSSVSYRWMNDGENRLVGVTISDSSGVRNVEYEYNDRGIRVGEVVDGVATRYLIDEVQPYAQVVEEYDSAGNPKGSYVYGYDLIGRVSGMQRSFYHSDGLGSTKILTNELGAVTDSYSYDAFGNLIVSNGSSNNAYLFAGEQRDSETSLDYLRARYYDPFLGRFISTDAYEGTLNDPMSLHDYLYAHANPVVNTDPSGYFTIAETHAAESIRNILAGVQIDTGINLILATYNYAQGKGEYKIGDFFLNVSLNAFFALAPILAPYAVSGVRGMIKTLKNPRLSQRAGAGRVIRDNIFIFDEIENPSVIQQPAELACGVTCGAMLLNDLGVNVSPQAIAAAAGDEFVNAKELAIGLNKIAGSGGSKEWYGQAIPMNRVNIDKLNGTGSWIAQVGDGWERHWIVVDGFNEAGRLKIRDPWGLSEAFQYTGNGTQYSVDLDQFLRLLTGLVVYTN